MVHGLVVPEHDPPPHEPKTYPELGFAVKVTDVPALTGEVHALPPQVKAMLPPVPGVVVMV